MRKRKGRERREGVRRGWVKGVGRVSPSRRCSDKSRCEQSPRGCDPRHHPVRPRLQEAEGGDMGLEGGVRPVGWGWGLVGVREKVVYLGELKGCQGLLIGCWG